MARLCETELNDSAKAAVAYRALIGSPWTEEALRKLEEIYEQSGDAEGLLEVLEARADRVKDPAEARALALKVAEQRAQRARDPQAALAVWDALAARFGSNPELDAKRVPLLERAGRWEDLSKLVELQVKSARVPAERAALLGQLGEMRADRLGNTTAALEAFREALALDSAEAKSRSAVEGLLSNEAARSKAAEVLEPVYRNENDAPGLVRVLEVRALEEDDAGRKLSLLGEAVSLVSRELGDPRRALSLAGQALELSRAQRTARRSRAGSNVSRG